MQVAMKFPTYGYQVHVKELPDSILSDSTRNISCNFKPLNLKMRGQLCLLGSKFASVSMKQYSWSMDVPNRFLKRPYYLSCQCSRNSGLSLDATFVKNHALNLARSCNKWQGSPGIVELALAVGFNIFIIWGLEPVVHLSKSMYPNKSDNIWKNGSTYHVAISYIQWFFIWVGAMLIFRNLDLVVPPTEAGKIVKQLLHFVRSMFTALTFHFNASRLYLDSQKFLETNDAFDTRKMVTKELVRCLYSLLRVVGTAVIMEFCGCYSFTEWDTGNVLKLTFFTILGDELWKLMRAKTPSLTSKDDAAAIRNPSTAAKDPVLASLIAIDGISNYRSNSRI